MPRANIIRELERSINEKFPDNIGKILIEAGFTTKTSILKLNVSCIRLQYVQENPEKFRSILKGTRYEHLAIFRFLPGHEALLQSLPEEIIKVNNKKEQKNTKKRRHSETYELSREAKSANVSSTNEIPHSASPNKKGELITKIRKFATKKNIPIEGFSEQNLLNFRSENAEYKCSVRCPYCPREVPCNNNKYWLCGNFTSHLIKHANTLDEISVDVSKRINSIAEPRVQARTIKRAVITDKELSDLFNFEPVV